MTDHDDQLDELASALLDGRGTPDDEARLTDDEALQARVAELDAARRAVRSIEPVDPARRDDMIAAALDAYAAEGDTRPDASTPPAQRRWLTRLSPILAAAAALILLAALVPTLLRSDDDPSFSSTGAAIAEAPSAERSHDDATDSTDGSSSGSLSDLGDFDDLAGLEAALRSTEPASPAPYAAAEQDNESRELFADDPSCQEEAESAGRVDERQQATVAGAPVLVVHVRPGPDGDATILVYAAVDCELLDELDLDTP